MSAVPGMVPRKAAPRTGGSEAPVQRGPHTSPNHPDGRTKDPYTDPRNPSTGGSKQSSPGPGPTGTGGGRDTPQAGQDRTDFEKARQDWARGGARGQGGNPRPPVYKPQGSISKEPPIPAPKKIPPIPGRTPLGPAGRTLQGSSAVHGMLPIY